MTRIIGIILAALVFLIGFVALGHGAPHPPQVVDRADGLCALLVAPQLNYNCEENVVETGDGFLLGVQRVSSKRITGIATKEPVFLLHGILLGGDVWVLNVPSEALGFILADAGYDVWIGNTRTTRFSYGHVEFQRTDEGFWDWSLDELVNEDLPAMLGLIYSITGSKTHYVGYSQGAQQAFGAFSQGQLLDYVKKVVMLAPLAYVDRGTVPLEMALFDFRLDKVLEAAEIKAFSFQTPMGEQAVDLVCGPNNVGCYNGFLDFLSGSSCCINQSKRARIDAYETQATSVKNLVQFAQQGRQSSFAKFDYGMLGNLERYGSVKPPEYNLANVPTDNILLITGNKDQLADSADITRLVIELPGNVNIFISPDFGHLDFIFADNANSHVYNQLQAFLQS